MNRKVERQTDTWWVKHNLHGRGNKNITQTTRQKSYLSSCPRTAVSVAEDTSVRGPRRFVTFFSEERRLEIILLTYLLTQQIIVT